MDTATTPTSARQELEHLAALKRQLTATAFRAWVVQPCNKPTILHFVNVEMDQLSEDIICTPVEVSCTASGHGKCDRASPAPVSAAERVAHVLSP
jgi:hypothetical protein